MSRRCTFYYQTAQICVNGHLVNDQHRAHRALSHAFCQQCGQETITSCARCNASITGCTVVLSGGTEMPCDEAYVRPRYCGKCGTAFPWTERLFDDIGSIIDQGRLRRTQKEELKQAIKDLVRTPENVAVAIKAKEYLKRLGPELGEGLIKCLANRGFEYVIDAIRGATGGV